MSTFLADARQTVAPPRDGNDGLLTPLLIAPTAVTGLVGSFSSWFSGTCSWLT
jgi:hypothetical protein